MKKKGIVRAAAHNRERSNETTINRTPEFPSPTKMALLAEVVVPDVVDELVAKAVPLRPFAMFWKAVKLLADVSFALMAKTMP